jgi:hypothetical protein
LGKLAEWTGARHKKVVGLRMAGETVFWTEDILVVVFGMRIAGGKKLFVVGLLAQRMKASFQV